LVKLDTSVFFKNPPIIHLDQVEPGALVQAINVEKQTEGFHYSENGLFTTSPTHVSSFPQMNPEASNKEKIESKKEEYIAFGIPEEWVEPLKALGNTTIEKIKAFEKPGKLLQEMMGYRKKNKLEVGTVKNEQVSGWISWPFPDS